jgi:ATP diphosphatase
MSGDIHALLTIMARLRDPDGGCPWDLKQSFASIAPYTIEEAYEVAEAIDRQDFDDLRDELGDLLFQVVFHARMAEEAGRFAFADVVAAICDKMLRRHPHVFGDAPIADAEAQTEAWEAIKRAERTARGHDHDDSALAGVARGLPEWQRALALQKRAARVGFDWPDAYAVLDKLHEEAAEVTAELDAGEAPGSARLLDEVGDLLFVAVNLARKTGVDVSTALRHANRKFEQRFRAMETLAAQEGGALADHALDAQERLWQRAKQQSTG